VRILRLSWQTPPRLDWLLAAREHGNAVPTLLPVPYRAVADCLNGRFRELILRRLHLLKADNIRLGFFEPAQQNRQSAVDAIDVEGRDFHALNLPPTC
jgi:hypothetical protein